jgi:hypothetical protein
MNITKYKLTIGALAFLLILTLSTAIIAQTPTRSELQRKNNQADALIAEATKLAKEGTAESMTTSLLKFEEGRRIFHEIGNKHGESYCLHWLGKINNLFGEKQKALVYFNQDLLLTRQVGDKGGEAGWVNGNCLKPLPRK